MNFKAKNPINNKDNGGGYKTIIYILTRLFGVFVFLKETCPFPELTN